MQRKIPHCPVIRSPLPCQLKHYRSIHGAHTCDAAVSRFQPAYSSPREISQHYRYLSDPPSLVDTMDHLYLIFVQFFFQLQLRLFVSINIYLHRNNMNSISPLFFFIKSCNTSLFGTACHLEISSELRFGTVAVTPLLTSDQPDLRTIAHTNPAYIVY